MVTFVTLIKVSYQQWMGKLFSIVHRITLSLRKSSLHCSPWKRDIIALPDNKELALCRLRKNTIRLSKLNKLNEYDMIMKEQIASGILEEVTESATSKNVHYIPHQAVIKEDAQSTKLRVVFDCS